MEEKLNTITWSSAWETGIEVFDNARRDLVNLFNRLVDLIRQGDCARGMPGLFFSLIHYAGDDLIREEILLRDKGFPGFSEHKAEHGRFIDHIRTLREQYDAGNDPECRELAHFLKKWFEEHLLDYDLEAIAFLRGLDAS